jgi:hypothetical protein
MIAPPRPPAHDELEALIKEARERQRRRRLLGAASVAIMAAIGLGIHALTVDGSGAAKVGRSSPNAAPPLCGAAQLTTSAFWQGATGSMPGGALIANTSDSSCRLPGGRPAVHFRWHGRALPAKQRILRANFSKPAHVLAAHERAVVWMQWYEWCGLPGAGTTLIRPILLLRFQGGLTLQTRAQAIDPPRCDPGAPATFVKVNGPFMFTD